MPIGNAQKFIHNMMKDADLREGFIGISTKNEFDQFLEKNDLPFTNDEFEDGFNNLLVNCQHQSLADLYYQIRFIYDSVTTSLAE